MNNEQNVDGERVDIYILRRPFNGYWITHI